MFAHDTYIYLGLENFDENLMKKPAEMKSQMH